MKLKTHIIAWLCMIATSASAIDRIYCIPGFASDVRLFANFDPGVPVTLLNHIEPKEDETFSEYALRFSKQIDTTECFAIVGASFGGMLAIEMQRYISPEKIFLVSSAINASGLPYRYRMMRWLPLNKVFGGKAMQKMSKLGRYLFEHTNFKVAENEALYADMMMGKSPEFLAWASQVIIDWKYEGTPGNVIQIHGAKDRVIPFRNVEQCYYIKDGTHTMMYFYGEEVSEVVRMAI